MLAWSCSKRHCQVLEQALWRLVGGLQPQKKIGMIDEMVAVLKEQKDDDSKEEYCENSLAREVVKAFPVSALEKVKLEEEGSVVAKLAVLTSLEKLRK